MLQEYENYIKLLEMDHSPHTLTSYKISIGKFLNYYQIDTIDKLKSITPTQCRDYLMSLKEAGLKNSSLNSRMRPLKAFFNHLLIEEIIEKSSWTAVRELRTEKKYPAYLSYEEIDAIISTCKNITERAMFVLFVTTGIRRNELITLKIEDVKDGHITVLGKGNKQRRLALQESVEELLKEYMSFRLDKWHLEYENLFLSTHGKPFTGNGIYKKINSLCVRAKFPQSRIKSLHPHSLRHTFAVDMLETSDIKTLQLLMGHSSMNTTNIYANVRTSALDIAIRNQRKII